VMDLIPVKPLAALEPSVKEAYVNTLSALHKKLHGSAGPSDTKMATTG
jgi:hypothetical protein